MKFGSPDAAVTSVIVPNLTSDETARILLQVSDGTNTVTEEVTLTLKNLVLTPQIVSDVVAEETLIYEEIVTDIISTSYFFETVNYLNDLDVNQSRPHFGRFTQDDLEHLVRRRAPIIKGETTCTPQILPDVCYVCL